MAMSIPFTAEARPKRTSGSWMRVSATAYCQHGITGSGAPTRRGSVAADPRVIPLGSTIHVRGLKGPRDGIYTVLDSGRAIKGHEIDVFIPQCGEAKRFGRQHVRVRVVERGSGQVSRR
ncbi:MAG TPA: 3D domain-containing protein [Vicinamibacterales bacterium]|nr:3D domain-containing protein [Vicinamibacterales bacterium]